MTSNRISRCAASLLAAGAVCLALAGTAAAAPGSLAFDGCLASSSAQGCVGIAPTALHGATSVAATADGKSVYVASRDGGSIALFTPVGPGGKLVFDGCLGSELFNPDCTFAPEGVLAHANGVAVSPSGNAVYVTSGRPGGGRPTLTELRRDPADGKIAFDGCVDDHGIIPTNLCGKAAVNSLDGAAGVAVSPDGRSIYVASERSDSISIFFRTVDGGLRFRDCFSSRADTGCRNLRDERLDGAIGVAVSPDGKAVYVASHEADAISEFGRALSGDITPSECFADRDSHIPNCKILEGPLAGANGVAVSPDSTSVYVTSHSAHSISTFARDGSGQVPLKFDGCLAFVPTPAGICQHGVPLIGARGVTVSADGQSVYVASNSPFSDSVAHLVRAPNGQLTFESCLDNEAGHCNALPQPSLGGANGVAISPNDKTVYVASHGSDSVSQFSRSASVDRRLTSP